MVYRYESAEDAFEENRPGADLPLFQPVPTAPAGPSPSRFPAPSLPGTNRPAPPAADAVPIRSSVQVPPTGAHGHSPTSPSDEPRSRRAGDSRGGRLWQVVVGGAAVLILLGLCGLGGAVLLIDRASTDNSSQNGQAAPTEPPSTAPVEQTADGPLDSRDTDRQPLTAKEVFPDKKLVIGTDRHEYEVLKTEAKASCAVAATGEIADLLVTLGCSQVVRATLRSPDGDHLVTAGLFNLTDLATAQRVRDRIRPLLDDRRGRFRGMPAGDDTESIATAAARVAWKVRGHYVAYCLVTRDDGGAVPAGDASVREVIYDLVDLHLDKGVLDRRAGGVGVDQPSPKATGGSATPRAKDPKTATPSATPRDPDTDTDEPSGD
ncbi:hypothetical protein ACIG87_06100 [Micromonospora sp. NPDC051925]|uniref:hypothetical protein n=1 Tax=Micromonospora sp. NPDC051925 TaxID=3364288 RepID=UPI0037C717EE